MAQQVVSRQLLKEPLRALFCLCTVVRFVKGRARKRQNTVALVVTFQAATTKISEQDTLRNSAGFAPLFRCGACVDGWYLTNILRGGGELHSGIEESIDQKYPHMSPRSVSE